MVVNVGINGMGRIGRSFWRVCQTRSDRVVAVNDLADAPTLAHLLRYDSVRGRLGSEVTAATYAIVVDGQPLRLLRRPELGTVPWGDFGWMSCWSRPGGSSGQPTSAGTWRAARAGSSSRRPRPTRTSPS